MLKKVVITNYLGEKMTYEIQDAMGSSADNKDWTSPETSGLLITDIDGLGPVKAKINMTDLTTSDGGLFNSARLEKRNIVITALFMSAYSIEDARLLSYKFFPIKRPLTFEIFTDNRTAKTVGYVESNEPDIFAEECSCKISIVCESPYFESTTQKGYGSFSSVSPLFRFRYKNEGLLPVTRFGELVSRAVQSIPYKGDADTGVEVNIYATGNAQDIEISNIDMDQKIVLYTDKLDTILPSSVTGNRDKLIAGDRIIITTYQKKKTVTFVRDGVRYPALNMLGKNPGWFTVSKGDNYYTYKTKTASEDKNVRIVITAPVLYEGV